MITDVNLNNYIIRALKLGTSKKGVWPTVEFIRDQAFKTPFFGAHGDEEIPVLIPNTEVKLISGDYTATSGKLARCRIIVKPSE